MSAGAPAPSDRSGSAGAASAAPVPAEEEFDPEDLFPPLSTPETRTPAPDNPAECPMTAPEDPVGDCLGLPVYLNCVYGTYNCVCDWYHWLCFG